MITIIFTQEYIEWCVKSRWRILNKDDMNELNY